jgi:hypothetical protein
VCKNLKKDLGAKGLNINMKMSKLLNL